MTDFPDALAELMSQLNAALAEIARLRLTDEERAVIEASREFWQVEAEAFSAPEDQRYSDTLRNLLERTK